MSDDKPRRDPGSPAALDDGCRCPIIDNRHGRGAYEDEHGIPQFWRVADCPLHGFPTHRGDDRHDE